MFLSYSSQCFKVYFCYVCSPHQSPPNRTGSKRSAPAVMAPRDWLDGVVMCLPVYTCCAEHPLTCTAGTDRQSHDNPAWMTAGQWETALTPQSIFTTSYSQEPALDLSRSVSDQAAYCDPPRDKATVPIKDNKTHCWNFYCASYSTLFLVVLINSLTRSFICTQLCGTVVNGRTKHPHPSRPQNLSDWRC